MKNNYRLPKHLVIDEWLHKYNILAIFGDNTIPYREFLQNPGPISCGDYTINPENLVRCKQTHSDETYLVHKKDAGAGVVIGMPEIPIVDGFICVEKGIFPFVVSADCTPIFIIAPDVEVIACIHSGRVGTERNILGKTLDAIIGNYHANPEKIEIKTGPAICSRHYPVDKKTHDTFIKNTGINQMFPYLDLRSVQLQEALEKGVLEKKISVSNICTYEDEKYSSYRENGTRERQINLIGILG